MSLHLLGITNANLIMFHEELHNRYCAESEKITMFGFLGVFLGLLHITSLLVPPFMGAVSRG